MTSNLELLLVQIRDGTADAGAVARARALVQADERIPAEVRDVALVDPSEAAEDAAGLLAVLGLDDLADQIADAIRAEAGPDAVDDAELGLEDEWSPVGEALGQGLRDEAEHFEIADAVMRRLPLADFAWGPVLVGAVEREAGAVDVTDSVLGDIDHPLQASVAAAVLAELGSAFGPIDVADAVMGQLGFEALPVRDAVVAEAGPVDVVEPVMTDIRRTDRAAMPSAVGAPAPIPTPANDTRRFGLVGGSFLMLAVAAVTLVVVTAGQLFGGDTSREPLMFAQAGDVVIEDLSYGSDVQVLQIEGDDGAVILWVDEEA